MKKNKFRYNAAMLIDDNEIDNFINMKMLEGNNFSEKIYVHTNGKSALEYLQNIERIGKKEYASFPDIIFLDLNMPIMDGFQFADEFEKLTEDLKKRTKIIILTTSLNPSDQERAKNYPHIVRFMNKPLTSQGIISL